MFEARVTVEWGDCDPAGIVFYPNFFRWMDGAFQQLLRGRGLNQDRLRERFGVVTPLVDVGAQFRSPARPGDALAVAVNVVEWHRSRFRLTYGMSVGDRPVAEGFEVRAWAAPSEGGGLRGMPIDPAFRDLLA